MTRTGEQKDPQHGRKLKRVKQPKIQKEFQTKHKIKTESNKIKKIGDHTKQNKQHEKQLKHYKLFRKLH